jgi:glycosyltransferase involved in cell wall biosynthesis
VLLEAMAAARPTVVSRVSGSGMTWVVEDGVTGLHTAPGDPQALAAALETLRNDPERARSMGRAGRLRFDKLFSIGPSVDSLVAVYQGVTAPGATR